MLTWGLAPRLPDWSTHTKLTVGGWLLEATGIILLAWDLIGPPIPVAWEWVLRQERRWIGWRTHATVEGATASARAQSITETAHVSVRSDATSIAELRDELGKLMGLLREVEMSVRGEISDLHSEIRATERALTKQVRNAITESKGEYFALRFLGLVIALAGSALLALANFF